MMVLTSNSGPASLAAKEIRLLGVFELRVGRPVLLPLAQQRLIGFTALCGRLPTPRAYVAGTLWPDSTDARAAANLRSSLWRVQQRAPGVIEANNTCLWLEPDVVVDAENLERRVEENIDGLAHELLTGWYDDWLVAERERFRQALIHALEARSRQLIDQGCFGPAIDLAWRAVRAEPLRESAHSLLIDAHISEGNLLAAVEHYQRWSHMLDEEFGIAPTDDLQRALVQALGRHPSALDLVKFEARHRAEERSSLAGRG